MRKRFVLFGLIFSMLLCACQEKEIAPDTEITTVEIEEKQQEETVTYDTTVEEVVLYDENGIQVILQASVSLESGENSYVLYAANHNDQERSISVKNWVFNDTVVIGTENVCYIDPKSEDESTLRELGTAISLSGDVIRKMQCHLVIKDENYELIAERDICEELAEPLVPAVIFQKFLGAKAGEQVLLDDAQVKITLLGWGKEPDNTYIRGLLHFENKSEQEVPVMIEGMSFNGVFLECHDPVNILQPGEECYSTGTLLKSNFEEAGITSISDMRLLILTDESETTSSVEYSGGAWYPVVLEEKGETSEDFKHGDLLAEYEDIKISMVSQDIDEWDDGGCYTWKLAVENNSEENIQVAVINLMMDNIEKSIWQKEYEGSFYMADDKVGAHAKRYLSLNVNFEEKMPWPTLQFRFQIRSMEGGSVLYTDEKEITILPTE